MNIVYIILSLISLTLLIWAATTTSYMFSYSVFGLLYQKRKSQLEIKDQNAPRVVIIIPAYQEDKVIIKTAESALRQSYPIGKYQVVVVADGLQRSTLYQLHHMPLKVIEVQFENSTKSKALNTALNQLPNTFDLVVVLDADNIIRPEFLNKMAEAYIQGHRAIQGHRTAKNFNTSYALLDAISEEINNHIFCKGQQYLGLSSRLTGSGMAFDYALFKNLMKEIHAVGGFDKELELKLIANDAKIHYVPDALVYDEKVSKPEVIAKQRSRWISSQIHYMKKYLPTGIVQLVKNRDFDYFNKSFQLTIPPRVFMVLIFLTGLTLSGLSSNDLLTYSWLVLLFIYISAFVFAFPKKFISRQLIPLVIALPNTFIKIFSSIPSMLDANKKFIHTPHES